MRRFLAAASVLFLATPARAAEYEHRDETTGFRLRTPANGTVCIAYPLEKRGGDCDGIDLSRVTQRFPNESLFIVRTTEWLLGVSVVRDNDGLGREWTDAEARAWRTVLIRKTPVEANVAIGPIAATRIAGLQVFTLRSEYGNTGSSGRTDLVVGDHGVTRVTYEFAASAAGTVAPVMDSIASTYDAAPATKTNTQIALTVATLLAGAPLVVIAAAIASRKREDA